MCHQLRQLARRTVRRAAFVVLPLSASVFFISCRSPAAVAPPEKQETLIAQGAAQQIPGGVMVVYPTDSTPIAASSTFIIGSCPPGSTLTCQGQPVRLNAQGFFAHVVALKPGANNFLLTRNNDQSLSRTITVNREAALATVPPGKPAFAPDSAEPKTDVGLAAGDLLPLSVRATPGGRVEVFIGKRKITLAHAVASRKRVSGTLSINLGMDTDYGKVFQRQAARQPDLYYGFYRVSGEDHWQRVKPRFVLTVGRHSAHFTCPGALSVVDQPRLARTVHDETVVRLGPGKARTTPLPESVRFLVDGWQDDSMRCLLAAGHHVWVSREDLAFDDEGGLPPVSAVRTVNVQSDGNGATLVVPLAQRLPYQLEQQLNPNRIILKIFGATSDTDWITQAPPAVSGSPLEQVTWKQPADHLYELTAHLKPGRQWGFWAQYQGTDLLLHLKGPPNLVEGGQPLSGATICIDPGHGGSETGAIGPSGVKESTVNLAIAARLRDLLEAYGASVVMTRQRDDQEVSLAERVKIALDARADLLISVHNNALPDGRDPWAEHGSSSYWYHPQATELARALKGELVKETALPDFGTNYQNLALCRPSALVATLIEVGFMINPDEYAQLITPEFQNRAAAALATGIRDYLRPPAR